MHDTTIMCFVVLPSSFTHNSAARRCYVISSNAEKYLDSKVNDRMILGPASQSVTQCPVSTIHAILSNFPIFLYFFRSSVRKNSPFHKSVEHLNFSAGMIKDKSIVQKAKKLCGKPRHACETDMCGPLR